MKSPPSDQQEVGTTSKHSQAKVLTAQPPLAKDDQIKDARNKLSMNAPTNARNSMVAANRVCSSSYISSVANCVKMY